MPLVGGIPISRVGRKHEGTQCQQVFARKAANHQTIPENVFLTWHVSPASGTSTERPSAPYTASSFVFEASFLKLVLGFVGGEVGRCWSFNLTPSLNSRHNERALSSPQSMLSSVDGYLCSFLTVGDPALRSWIHDRSPFLGHRDGNRTSK